jgi:hypothetical protein
MGLLSESHASDNVNQEVKNFVNGRQGTLQKALKMDKQKALNDLERTFKTKFMERALGLAGGQGDQDEGKEVKNQSGINLNHDAILGGRDNILQREEVFDEIEKDFNLPALGIEVENE